MFRLVPVFPIIVSCQARFSLGRIGAQETVKTRQLAALIVFVPLQRRAVAVVPVTRAAKESPVPAFGVPEVIGTLYRLVVRVTMIITGV